MKLSDYLAAKGKTASDLASELGVAVSTVTRAASGHSIPSPDLMGRIARATKGRVTPNDFFDLKEKVA